MNPAPLNMWLATPLPSGVAPVLERLQQTPGVVQIAVMPDVHLASEFCVGTVVASDTFIFPNAVGGDIGCGMLAMPFDADADALKEEAVAARLLGLLEVLCPSRRHHHKTAHQLPAELCDEELSDPQLEAHKRGEESRRQLGTLGAGNHFLEFQADEHNQLWLMIHTGSRHLGQRILHHHLPKAQKLDTGIMALETNSPAGAVYLHDVVIARAWAKENRRLLAEGAAKALAQLLNAKPTADAFDCDHNHVQLETHADRQIWVHRKGATAAHENVPGIIPGSMGTRSFHTLGKGNPDALHSSSHGAGRNLSRTEAKNSITISALRQQLRGVWYDARLERHLREEAPRAYKNIDAVMQAQQPLTQITRQLRPLLVYKGT
jgi:tRNA-splicing ligase RtcB